MPAPTGGAAAPDHHNGGGGGGNFTYSNGTGGAGGGAGTTNYIYTDPWTEWNFQYNATITSTGTGGTQWITWNEALYGNETEEQRQEREARQRENDRVMQLRYEEQRIEAAERTRIAQAAAARASELLIELLSDEQRRTWSEHHYFEVVGSASGRTYRIRRGIVNNVDRLSADGTVRDRVLCAHPTDIPDDDCHLAQMLLLVTDENEFVRIANHHGVAGLDAQLPENRDAYRAARQYEREMRGRVDHEPERTPGERFHYTLDRLQELGHVVEGVPLEPVTVGIDIRRDDPAVVFATTAYVPPAPTIEYSFADVAVARHMHGR